MNKEFELDNKKSKALLGMKYDISVEKTLVDMVRSCATHGLIEDKIKEVYKQ
jgi:hypothetical protein